MKSVIRRVERREHRLAPHQEREPFLVVYTRSDRKLALDNDACVQILRECGFLRSGPTGAVNLGKFPGLDAAELKTFLREHGRRIVTVSAVNST